MTADAPALRTAAVPIPHWFIVPRLDGPVSGGTRYNRELLAALEAEGFACSAVEIDRALDWLREGRRGVYWLDTLHLGALPTLCRVNVDQHPLGLLTHYLPSLVRSGASVEAREIGAAERFALARASAFLVTSSFMRHALQRLGAAPRPKLVVEPGCSARRRSSNGTGSRRSCHAVMIGNLTAGKGVLPFLSALAQRLRPDDCLRLTVVGGSQQDPQYATRCRQLVASEAALNRCVHLAGALPESSVEELLSDADLAVSASVMESYGMALCEARTVGVPIVAVDAGNVRAHVVAEAGGELVQSHEDLAAACLRLSRTPVEVARRSRLAHARAPLPRSWQQAAREFIRRARAVERAEPRS